MVAQMKRKNYNAAAPPPANSTPSFRLDVGRPDDLAPDLGLDFDAVSELLRRACDHFEAERRQALLHVQQGKNCHDLALERADNLVRRSGGRQESDPTVAFDLRIAGLGGRRYVGEELRAPPSPHPPPPSAPPPAPAVARLGAHAWPRPAYSRRWGCGRRPPRQSPAPRR